MSSLKSWRKRTNQLLSEYSAAKKIVVNETLALEKAGKELRAAQKAQHILQNIAQQIQQKVHNKIALIVSRCLEAIFAGEYGFEFEFERKRGRTEAIPVVLHGDKRVYNPMKGVGGSTCQIASMGGRVANLIMTRPARRRYLQLDEPFMALDLQKQEKIRDMIEELSHELALQIVLVTHSETLRCGKVIEL